MPVLAVLLPGTVPSSMLLGLLPMTLLVTWRDRQAIDGRSFVGVSVARLPGIVAGTWLVTVVSTDTLTLFVAGMLVAAVALVGSGWRVPATPTSERIVGAVSGFTGTAAALGGPPLALLYQQASGAGRRATMNAVFSVGIVVALSLLALGGEFDRSHLGPGGAVGVGQLLGAFLVVPVVRRASEDGLRRGVLVWAAVGAVAAAGRVLVG